MSNRLDIYRLEIKDSDGSVSQGFEACDNYNTVVFTSSFLKDGTSDSPLIYLLKIAKGCEDSIFKEMLASCLDTETGLAIDNQWFDFDEIESILEASRE